MSEFVLIALCCSTEQRDKLLSLCILPACVLTGSPKIPLLQPQQTLLLQTLYTVQVLQSLHHHHGSLLDSPQHVWVSDCPSDPSWSSTAPLVLPAQLCLVQLGWLP